MAPLSDLTPLIEKVQNGGQLDHADGLELVAMVQRHEAATKFAFERLHKEREANKNGEREVFFRKVQGRLEARAELVMRALDVVLSHWTLHNEKNSRNWRKVADQMADYLRVILDGDAHLLVISDGEYEFSELEINLTPDAAPDYSGDRG
jgi:hypothetical protein